MSIFQAFSALPGAKAVIQACCDIKFRVTPSICLCSWQKLVSLIVTTTASSQEHSGEKELPRVDVDVAYSTIRYIRASLEHKRFQTCFESLRYGMRDQVVFALRSRRETV